jgi:hypothetical protein
VNGKTGNEDDPRQLDFQNEGETEYGNSKKAKNHFCCNRLAPVRMAAVG